jgi:hypothetical protein
MIRSRSSVGPQRPDIQEIVARIKARYKQPVIEMSGGFLGSAIGGFKTMRDELVRLGFGYGQQDKY